ncbi:MAG TPA: hypothetical protein VEU96_04600 [Bryobacteraceae bacterium]|nr:hypothetical protein [Bryobacteraceae bacterium]
MKGFLLSMAIAAMACAQPGLAPPQIGFIQDSSNALRPVIGIAGNFLLGDPMQTGLTSAAFSGLSGMVKTDSALLAIDRQGQPVAASDAPSGSALFAFSQSGAPSFVYFVDANAWMTWDGQQFQPGAFDLSAFDSPVVVSIASPNDGEAQIILQRDDGLWDIRLQLSAGTVTSQSAIPGVTAPMLALANGNLIYRDADGLVLRKPDGSELHIPAPLPPNIAFQQMGDGWIQIRDLDTPNQFAVRITEGREQFYQLPEADE